VPRNEQGELQGALTSLISVTTIIGPVVMTFLFSFFTKPDARIHFAGAPFLLGAILMLGSALIAYYTLKGRKTEGEIQRN
jgi:DHA1 family tetracycline resistance protein-like MFS transporter